MRRAVKSSAREQSQVWLRTKPEDTRTLRRSACAWIETFPERQRHAQAWSFIHAIMEQYVEKLVAATHTDIKIAPPDIALPPTLDDGLSPRIAGFCAELSLERACFEICSTYTSLLPIETRNRFGIFYTPPSLSSRLLDMVEACGVNWRTVSVLDPACGGGAFLLPIASRMKQALQGVAPSAVLDSITQRIKGFEIDPLGAWLTEAWVQIGLADISSAAGRAVPSVVRISDALATVPDDPAYDLIIANPPYGRITLPAETRTRFSRSLYGHANLYGLFTDLALRWVRRSGLMAFVTPTSFLAGEYFKNLRRLLADEAPPAMVSLIGSRKGVFEGVLQETMLSVYKKGALNRTAVVHHVRATPNSIAHVERYGRFSLPDEPSCPWILPRSEEQRALTARLRAMGHRLSDWGYEVSTGPLVWNRHKKQLRDRPSKRTKPLIWAEAVTSTGQFVFKAVKRNHKPYFELGDGDGWLRTSEACVLLQRTTAKEQSRRLIAAELPVEFLRNHGAVVIENHLNVLKRRKHCRPKVTIKALCAYLNSSVADAAFRCISGSVAVSAFELESLPLPSPLQMRAIERLIKRDAGKAEIDNCIKEIFFGRTDESPTAH